MLKHLKHPKIISNKPYWFVLADGIAPFEILGIAELSVQFSHAITKVEAHIARRLCTDMILGMDYINRYNLAFDVKNQSISIEYCNKLLKTKIDSDYELHKISVTSSKSVYIPPYSIRSTNVTVPIASVCSALVPNQDLYRNNTLFLTHSFLKFRNYHSTISLCNASRFPRYIRKGYCVGFLSYYALTCSLPVTYAPQRKSGDATRFSGVSTVDTDLRADNLLNLFMRRSFIPPLMSQLNSIKLRRSSFCNTIQTAITFNDGIQTLVNAVENKQHRDKVLSLLTRFSKIFDTSKHNVAKTSIHHVINTVPHSPPACKPYPQPDKEQAMYKLMQEFLQAGLISESHSPYAAPAILVKKKDGSYRFVVDYKRLNLVTIKDSSPLPNMEEAIRCLGQGYSYFSKLDLKSGFYQIPIRNDDKEKTAFITPFGLYQFNVLPMGLKNSPPTFQRVMADTLKCCRNFSLVYLDDIIVFSKSLDEHLYHLERVFKALQSKNFTLNPPKCVIAANQIDYLGHTISQKSITPMKEKIQAILAIQEPRSLAQANKFIGALSWYRKFLPNFATVAAPIHAVTNLTKDKRHKFKWKYAQSKAFHTLKRMLVSEPLFLHYPIEAIPLILTTDASGIGIGGVLQQEIDGEVRNLYYHSQLMTPCERKYSAIEKEALAIYKCFNRMRTYLLGRNIILRTDHCPLCHIMEKTVRNARIDRITHLIQEYNIDQVIHIKGRENCLPDFLSRYPKGDIEELFEIDYGLESKSNSNPTVSLIPKHITPLTSSQNDTPKSLLATMTLRPRSKQRNIALTKDTFTNKITTQNPLHDNASTTSTFNMEFPKNYSFNQFDLTKLKQEQQNDPNIQHIVNQIVVHKRNLPFVLKNNILYKLITPSPRSRRKRQLIYLPSSMTHSLLQACHDDPMSGAHFSIDRTYNKIRNLYWWPAMKSTIRRYIQSCLLCKQYNVNRHKNHGYLRPIDPPEGPFLLIGIDYCGPLKSTPRENQYVLVITDYFTRHVTAIALPNCTAETTAQALFNEYFCKYGVPAVILSDQGPHFRNQLMANIKHLIGYNHIYSTPYHPQTNGIVERFNATFIPQISKLQDTHSNNWDEYLQAVVFAYNTGIHKTTKYSPYELLYGRSARLPIHIRPSYFSFTKPNDYFEQLRRTLRIYHQATRHNILLQQQNNKNIYNLNRLNPHYKIGDKVLTRIPNSRGKLEPKFSPVPKVITQLFHPIYEVQDEESHLSSRVHVGDLRPILVE